VIIYLVKGDTDKKLRKTSKVVVGINLRGDPDPQKSESG